MALSTTPKLISNSLGTWRRQAKTLTLVTAIIAVPANLIQLVLPSGDSTISSYISLAAIVMNLALLWAIIHLGDQKVTLRQAYYRGTASFVRYLLVSVLIVLELIPMALGLLLYSVGVVGAAPGTSAFEQGLVGILALLLALPSLFWFNRTILGMVEVVAGEAGPVESLRRSWRRVKGHSWTVLGRLVVLLIIAALLMLIPTLILTFLYQKTANRGFLALLQVFASIILLPIIDVYLVKLYQELA